MSLGSDLLRNAYYSPTERDIKRKGVMFFIDF